MVKEKNTENKILEAAKKIFVKKGMHGARMQEIADEAGINKALLHYYFRSKDKLFEAIFQDLFNDFSPVFIEVLKKDASLEDKITEFVFKYTELLQQNPFIPLFIFNEVHQNQELLKGIKGIFDANLRQHIGKQLQEGIEAGKYRDISLQNLWLTVISLCIMPFLGQPLFQFVFSYDASEYKQMLDERKHMVPELIKQFLIKQ